MTKDVIEQLEAYGDHADRIAPAITVDDLDRVLLVAPTTRRSASSRMPGWAVAMAAALVAFIVIGGGLWLLGGGTTDPISEPGPSCPLADRPVASADAAHSAGER